MENKMKKLSVFLTILVFLFLIISCETDNLPTGSIKNSVSIDSISKTSDSYALLAEKIGIPIINYLIDNPEWITSEFINECVSGQPSLSKINIGKKKVSWNAESEGLFEKIDDYSFKIDSVIFEIRLDIDPGTINHLDISAMRSKINQWGIMFDPDYFSDIPKGYIFLSNNKGNITKVWYNLTVPPKFPLFILSFEEIKVEGKNSVPLKKVNSGSDWYICLKSVKTLVTREGADRGNMEFELYICSNDQTWYNATTDHIFNGVNRIDAAGRTIYYPDVNDAGVVYNCDYIALTLLSSQEQFICAIESDTGPSGNHNNDEDEEDPSRKVADIEGINLLTGLTWLKYGRQWRIVSNPSGTLDDDIFYNSELARISTSTPSTYLPSYPSSVYITTDEIRYEICKRQF